MKHIFLSFWEWMKPRHPRILCQEEGPVAINVQDLSVSYPHVSVISHLTCQFEAPGLWAIVGPNGAGKSTFFKTLLGLQKYDHGTIRFQGFSPCDVGYLTQQHQLDRRFPLTVQETIAMGLFREVGLFRRYSAEQRRRMQEALDQVGLPSFAKTSIQTLSGGQFQRVLFARLILQDAPVIFLDEPFTGVDEQTVEDLMTLLGQWVRQGRLIIAVLHDIEFVRKCFPETLLLARHFYKIGETEGVLTQDNLYAAMMAARQWEEFARRV